MDGLGIANDELSRKVMEGFKINWMSMRDGETGKVHWECKNWNNNELEKTEFFPKNLLKCRIVTREINFTSKEQIKDFNLLQRIWLAGKVIEEWHFKFGFVIPNSTNTWEQTIEAVAAEDMIPIEILNSSMMIETLFLIKDQVIYRSKMRVQYK